MHDLVIEFFVPRVDHSKLEGKRMISMVCQMVPEMMPEFYNTYEPVNKHFDLSQLETALAKWHFSFLWKRKKPSIRGVMYMGTAQLERPMHTCLSIRAKLTFVNPRRLISFIKSFSRTFQVDIGLAHVLTKPEIESKRLFALSTHMLKESLPNLYWITVFGKPYVELFGKERLLCTPAAEVMELGNDLVYIQLTADLTDNRIQSEKVESAREDAKNHLNSNVFFDSEKSPNFVYSKPEFHVRNGTIN